MISGLVAAVFSTVCYGVAAVLLAVGARRAMTTRTGKRAFPLRTLWQWPFLAGLFLDGLAFAAQLWALQSLPVYVVQAATAASLAVTAVVAIPVLGLVLRFWQWAAVVGVCAGLALLGLSAGAESVAVPSREFQFALIGAVAVLALAGVAVYRLPGRARAVALGLVAGLSFGVVALAARSLGELTPQRLVREPTLYTRDPTVYALVAAAIVAYIFYTIGLRRAAVTTVTAALTIGETVLPAVIGVLVLADATRPGYFWHAVAGFVLAVSCSVALARFGEPDSQRVPAPVPS